ncbi:acyl-CoA synthetase (AMP-forming)/AMP-acid ligase II [Janthinobacterium sp. CG_23.3]|uniref:fatty acyl-AMP ligase n=1 Tax=Janthinobacterium sp. CG_23.3 TaxID=3349634 RepID=UPI0038D46652
MTLENAQQHVDGRNFPTLVELLKWRALHQSQQVAYTFLVDGEDDAVSITFGQLDRRAKAIAAQLAAQGVGAQAVLLLYPAGLEFIVAFFGALYAGAIAVPLYPPHRNRPDQRLAAVIADSDARYLMTTADILGEMARYVAQTPALAALRGIATDTDTAACAALAQPAQTLPHPSHTAFLQYTSGSTSSPKGVMVSHRNLMANLELIRQSFGHTEKLKMIGWLPLFHDMGLVGNTLQPLYVGGQLVFMSPVHFLQNPMRWLRTISRHRATTSGGPNFAYDFCVRRSTPEQRAGLDLSSWEVAFNGAEPVRLETLDRFAAAFAPHGFRRGAFLPCYGMAEATLLLAAGDRGQRPVSLRLDSAALLQDRVRVAADDAGKVSNNVGCGQIADAEKIAIVDPQTLSACAPDRVGEIWVAGDSVTQGYWNRPAETREKYHARLAGSDATFLRTGDLGFIHGNELFITGRLKDLIIIRGANYYPQDIERSIEEAHPAVRESCCAAFSVEVEGEERLLVALEVDRKYVRALDLDELTMAVQRNVFLHHELRPHVVCVLKPGGIPKTSSGKIRRGACKDGFLNGNLDLLTDASIPKPDSSTKNSLETA